MNLKIVITIIDNDNRFEYNEFVTNTIFSLYLYLLYNLNHATKRGWMNCRMVCISLHAALQQQQKQPAPHQLDYRCCTRAAAAAVAGCAAAAAADSVTLRAVRRCVSVAALDHSDVC